MLFAHRNPEVRPPLRFVVADEGRLCRDPVRVALAVVEDIPQTPDPEVSADPLVVVLSGPSDERVLLDLLGAIPRGEVVAFPNLGRPGLAGAPRRHRIAKRALDVVGSFVGLIVSLPLLAAAAAAIAIGSRGPVLFIQERLGRDARPFKMAKLRTMCVSAEDDKAALMSLNERRGAAFKIKDDPRITRVGRLLRKLSIDELPQLVNVLLGQMSLVGPRPPLREEYERYTPWQRERLSVKPGLTGLWQVSGRSLLDFDACVGLDLRYIRTWSLLRDLVILLRTIPAVLTGRGAY